MVMEPPPEDDWTERHRPDSVGLMEGNEAQLRRIRQWLGQWEDGRMPERRGLLLAGVYMYSNTEPVYISPFLG